MDSDPGSRERPNLLFVFADQWRKQAVGCLDEDPVQTPSVDRFAGEGLLFTNALSTCPVCVPARACILTGRYPTSNRVIHNGRRIPDDEVTIAEMLKAQGYDTGYIGKWHLDGRHHEDQFVPVERRHGFDFWYANNMVHHLYIREYYTGIDTHIKTYGWQPDHETEVAIEYIKEHREGPFALFLSWTPPHGGREHAPDLKTKLREGHIAPEEYERIYADVKTTGRGNFSETFWEDAQPSAERIPGYFGAITSLDENFGRLMAFLEAEGLADNTVVVLHSDHGEMLGSQGRIEKQIWYEESVGVPFIIRWPGRIEPGREAALFNQVDIVPSLLGLLQAPRA